MPSIADERLYDRETLAGLSFGKGWYNFLAGMDHLPFDYAQFRQTNTGSFSTQIVNNDNTANNIYNQFVGQKKKIPDIPSRYQYLKDNIFDGLE